MFGNRLGHAFSEMLAGPFRYARSIGDCWAACRQQVDSNSDGSEESESSSPKNFAGGAFGIGEYY